MNLKLKGYCNAVFYSVGESYLGFVVAFKLVNEKTKTSIDDSDVQFVQKWKLIYYRNGTRQMGE